MRDSLGGREGARTERTNRVGLLGDFKLDEFLHANDQLGNLAPKHCKSALGMPWQAHGICCVQTRCHRIRSTITVDGSSDRYRLQNLTEFGSREAHFAVECTADVLFPVQPGEICSRQQSRQM
eukprot:313221-Rhodomonas_salina.1